jgi:hypothetical protein
MKFKNWILKQVKWITNIFMDITEEMKVIIPIGIKVVEGLKTFVLSNSSDALTALIPGGIDDGIKETLRVILPKILVGLKNWNAILVNKSIDTQLRLIIEELNSYHKTEKDGLKLQIATKVNEQLLGGKISTADVMIVTLTTYHYPETLNDVKSI